MTDVLQDTVHMPGESNLEHVDLELVDRVYEGFGPPPIVRKGGQYSHRLGDLLQEALTAQGEIVHVRDDAPVEALSEADREKLRIEAIETLRSVRRNRGPHTIVHALILEDRQTLGEIAARLHVDPRTIRPMLGRLARSGFVVKVGEDPIERYSLFGLDGQ